VEGRPLLSWLRSGELVRKITGNYGNGRIVLSIPLHFSNLECFIFGIGDTEYIELRTLLPEEYTGFSFLYDLLEGEPV
jgi:hypothetical protein